jgi:hypothetical protein
MGTVLRYLFLPTELLWDAGTSLLALTSSAAGTLVLYYANTRLFTVTVDHYRSEAYFGTITYSLKPLGFKGRFWETSIPV